MLEIAGQAEKNTETKRGKKKPRTIVIIVEVSSDIDEVLEVASEAKAEILNHKPANQQQSPNCHQDELMNIKLA